jgi:hypothetical protein
MSGHTLEPLQALRRSEEEQAMSRLSEAVASRVRAEAGAEARRRQVNGARARLADALRTSGSLADSKDPAQVIIASQIHMRASFIERLHIEERHAEQRLAAFRGQELAQARAAEEEAREAYRQHRGNREGLDKHLATLADSERRRAERLADEA